MSPQVQIIIMAACLLMSAYFSATETAFSTLSKTKLKTMVEKGNKRAPLALKLSENYDRLLSTILDRKSTRLNSSHLPRSRMPSSA